MLHSAGERELLPETRIATRRQDTSLSDKKLKAKPEGLSVLFHLAQAADAHPLDAGERGDLLQSTLHAAARRDA